MNEHYSSLEGVIRGERGVKIRKATIPTIHTHMLNKYLLPLPDSTMVF